MIRVTKIHCGSYDLIYDKIICEPEISVINVKFLLTTVAYMGLQRLVTSNASTHESGQFLTFISPDKIN